MNELIERLRSRAEFEDNGGVAERQLEDVGALLREAAAALASPTGGVVKPTEDAVELVADAINAARYDTPIWREYRPGPLPRLADEDSSSQEYARRLAKAAVRALEAASSPAPGEAVAWQWKHFDPISGSPVWVDKQYWNGQRSDVSRALYASPPTSPPEPVQGVLEALKAARTHLITLGGDSRATVADAGDPWGDELQAAVLDIVDAAIANAERSPFPLGGWKDISTAPKDWSDVLLFDRNREREVFEGYYSCEDGGRGCWVAAGSGHECEPTKWHPLPPSPSGDA